MSIQPSGPASTLSARPPAGFWAALGWWAALFFKAWTTPQRICGCKPPRRR